MAKRKASTTRSSRGSSSTRSSSASAKSETAGGQVRALVGFHYCPASIDAKLQRGDVIPRDKRGEQRVEAGEIVAESELPARSVPWMLEQGLIERVAGSTSSRERPDNLSAGRPDTSSGSAADDDGGDAGGEG